MRSPEHRQLAQPRAGRDFAEDLQLHYLSPGAFTVLPTNNRHPPDPPAAPEPYRLTPSTRRHKNQSFAIIGDVDPAKSASRSSSPTTGRVSPFRGRGFNPIGSRHASPSTSPTPPEDSRLTPTNLSPRHSSKIPKLKRRPSNGAFGEKVHHYNSSPTKRKISNKLSQSLTDLQVDKNGNRPPVHSRRTYSKKPAFQRLSPIIGSSPEPSQSMSSPSRIPKSHSTPPSRKASPTRNTATTPGRPPLSKTPAGNRSRNTSRNPSRNPSRNASREPSPTKTPTSPSRIPVTKYGKVPARVNSFKKAKPKVPTKNQVVSEQSDDTDTSKNTSKTALTSKLSVSKIRANSRPNLLPKTGNYGNNYTSTSDSSVTNTNETASRAGKDSVKATNGHKDDGSNKNTNRSAGIDDKKTSARTDKATVSSNNNATKETVDKTKTADDATRSEEGTLEESTPSKKDMVPKQGDQKQEKLPSTTTVVSSTTSTVAQPLKIDTNLNFPHHYEGSKPISPMVDGRVLSATSVSNAINKMNDTVLDSQTVMKDHGFSKLSPAASAIISVAKESNKGPSNPALDTKNATTALPTVEPIDQSVGRNKEVHPNSNHSNNHSNNHTNSVSHVMSSKALELEVQKHMQKLITPEHTMSETLRKSRTVIASDVQPIRITVREKPSDVEVQSGNVRLPVSATNGINERPSLPPSQSTPPNEPEKEAPPKNACSKFFSNCKKRTCRCCSKKGKSGNEGKTRATLGCFNCLKKKKKNVPATIIVEDEINKKTKCFDRLRCCKTKKIGDLNCFPKARRKESWAERRDSILSTATPPKSRCSKDCCKNIMRKIFCVNLCCKKKVEAPVRQASIISKKKSLTPTTAPPPEEVTPKIDLSLVEHSSHMKAAIPILPICLAWFCLVLNCLLPGTGTVFSGMFCLCIGIPRFSQKDGPRGRIGSFIINCLIGFSQFFTVLFCLVGWGWSIWWGVIMLRVAKKHKRFKHLEAIEQASITHQLNQNSRHRDPERRP